MIWVGQILPVRVPKGTLCTAENKKRPFTAFIIRPTDFVMLCKVAGLGMLHDMAGSDFARQGP